MLRIFTLNIHQYGPGHGAWEARRELIVAAVRESSPEVIAFQAVRRDPAVDGGTDQATQIARRLDGYAVSFVPATVVGQGVDEGSAMLSRVPVVDHDVRILDLVDDEEDATTRLVVRARVSSGGRLLDLCNCHFSWINRNNERNVEQAVAYLTSLRGPRLIVGDFNAPPDSPSLAPLRAAGFIDVWERLRPNESGFTFEQGRLFTRIDQAWASPELDVSRGGRGPGVRSIDLAPRDGAAGGVHASDHLGLVVSLDLG